MENKLIPQQISGSQMDAVAEKHFGTPTEAMQFYELAKNKLIAVNNWAKVCGTEATTFELLNENGEPTNQLVIGNLIKIDIPGPGTGAGNGYDWVKISAIADETTEEESYFGFQVNPCKNPQKPTAGVAHFFKSTASSTFLIRCVGETVYAEMHGRNEEPNTVETDFIDGLRNVTVGYSAKIGLSYPQWKLLVEGLVDTDQNLTDIV